MAAGSQRSLLKDRDFLLVSLAVGLSAMGDWVAITALGLHVEELTDDGYAVAAEADVPTELEAAVSEAVESCPEQAITAE